MQSVGQPCFESVLFLFAAQLPLGLQFTYNVYSISEKNSLASDAFFVDTEHMALHW